MKLTLRKKPARPTPRRKPAARKAVPASVGLLVQDGVIRARRGSGLADGIVALGRAAVGDIGTVLRFRKKDVVVLPFRYLELLERLIEKEEDRIDIAEADRVLADPTETAIAFEDFVRDRGLNESD